MLLHWKKCYVQIPSSSNLIVFCVFNVWYTCFCNMMLVFIKEGKKLSKNCKRSYPRDCISNVPVIGLLIIHVDYLTMHYNPLTNMDWPSTQIPVILRYPCYKYQCPNLTFLLQNDLDLKPKNHTNTHTSCIHKILFSRWSCRKDFKGQKD